MFLLFCCPLVVACVDFFRISTVSFCLGTSVEHIGHRCKQCDTVVDGAPGCQDQHIQSHLREMSTDELAALRQQSSDLRQNQLVTVANLCFDGKQDTDSRRTCKLCNFAIPFVEQWEHARCHPAQTDKSPCSDQVGRRCAFQVCFGNPLDYHVSQQCSSKCVLCQMVVNVEDVDGHAAIHVISDDKVQEAAANRSQSPELVCCTSVLFLDSCIARWPLFTVSICRTVSLLVGSLHPPWISIQWTMRGSVVSATYSASNLRRRVSNCQLLDTRCAHCRRCLAKNDWSSFTCFLSDNACSCFQTIRFTDQPTEQITIPRTDQNCGFRSVAYAVLGDQDRHPEMRAKVGHRFVIFVFAILSSFLCPFIFLLKCISLYNLQIVDFIEDNEPFFAPHCEKRGWLYHTVDMRTAGCWMTEVELLALACLLQTNIWTFRSVSDNCCVICHFYVCPDRHVGGWRCGIWLCTYDQYIVGWQHWLGTVSSGAAFLQ